VDRDPTNDPQQVTGARVVPGDPTFGADALINIAGKAGRVITSLSDMHQWTVAGWQEIQGQTPSAASDFHRLEVQVPLGTIGMNPSHTPETYFYTTDWRGNYDDTQPYANRGPTASSVFVEERSVAPDTVKRGDENVPMLRLDLENREEAPAEITEIYVLLEGTATENEIDTIRLWTGDRVFNNFDEERFEQVSKGNTWNGRNVLVDLTHNIVVNPYDTLSLFVTVDISETATTLLWFDVYVLAGKGIISSSSVIATEIHDSYNLVRIWNTTGGRFDNTIGINEVKTYEDDFGSGDLNTKKWIELVNPTNGTVDIGSWTLEYSQGATYKVLYTFSSSATFTAGPGGDTSYMIVYPTANLKKLVNGTHLYLKDDTGSTVSYILVGTTDFGETHSRYRVQGSDEPHGSSPTLGSWYIEDTPTPNARNDEIPEFSDIIYPLMGTLVVYAVVRRRSTGRSRDERTAPAPA